MDFVWVVHGDEYAALCAKSIETVRRHNEDARCCVYSDRKYASLDKKANYYEVVEGYHDVPFMLMNVLCQSKHLFHMEPSDTVCFLDVDAFMVKELPDMERDWDVAPTWRDNMGQLSDLMPYNYGVIFARATIQAMCGWLWMADHITHQTEDRKKWYGNQVALRELCGPPVEGIQVRDHSYFDIRVKPLPCTKWNWTPDDDNPKVSPSGHYFVHFKGNRKDLADWYHERCVA